MNRGDNLGEWLVIAVLVLIVLGPKSLPDVGRQLAAALVEMRRLANEWWGPRDGPGGATAAF